MDEDPPVCLVAPNHRCDVYRCGRPPIGDLDQEFRLGKCGRTRTTDARAIWDCWLYSSRRLDGRSFVCNRQPTEGLRFPELWSSVATSKISQYFPRARCVKCSGFRIPDRSLCNRSVLRMAGDRDLESSYKYYGVIPRLFHFNPARLRSAHAALARARLSGVRTESTICSYRCALELSRNFSASSRRLPAE
jgi:hypothetical protein